MFNQKWEDDIYACGRQLNRYPFDAVISFVMSTYGGAADRSQLKVLDIGCGSGNNTWFLAREGFDVTAIDGSSSAIQFARDRLAQEGLSADLQVQDFTQLDLPTGTYDFIIDRCSVTHNPPAMMEKIYAQLAEALKPGGKIYAQAFADDHGHKPHGQQMPDGSWNNFTAGIFAEIGQTSFSTAADIKRYFAPLTILHMRHTRIEDHATDEAQAYWDVIAQKN